ncbi:nucleoside/nucleotide kinase family protein [Microbacterium testaceum]|uniref:nucleoside/nucleotide kinase family protein n=1 Tax=Microbacterium testaceum TaxID=2033 RepID=UPI001D17CF41|nr:nucleoside/nucleotide kinase family protein [Microbacterium testaceum]MCC4250333.1 nucleoside/nucleotide kinase family protein [Microbacterium testaceum]
MDVSAAPPAAAVSVLADRVERAASGSSRFLLGIAGSPGSGKTTLATVLVAELNTRRSRSAAVLPMDGFHLANATLDRLGRRDRKGAIDTFDGWGFLSLLRRVREETDHTVFAPSFRREVDEGVTGEIAVEPEARVVVVEGNYLLVDDGPWAQVRPTLDEAWFCAAPDATRECRLVERHTRHGRTAAAAAAWAREVDGVNAAVIEATRPRAHLIVSGETGAVVD